MEFLLPLLLSMPPAAMAAISVSLGFAVIFTALFYFSAYFFQSPQLMAVSKEELSALIFSAVIIMFWMTMDVVLNQAANGLLISAIPPDVAARMPGGSEVAGLSATHVDLAYSCLEVLFIKLKDMYTNLYLFEVLIGFLSTVSFPIGSPVPAVNVISLSLAPFTGLVLLSNAHTTVVEAIGYAMTLIWAKQFILLFCRDIIPILLLPLGLVMRAFPFFRTTGSSVIALSFVGYFVLPFAILLSNYMIFDLYEPSEFAYTPEHASMFSGTTSTGGEVSASDVDDSLQHARTGSHTEEMVDLFSRRPAAEEVTTDGGACHGNAVRRVLCGGWNIIRGAASAAVELARTAWNIGVFMVGMTGDFVLTAFNNPLMPASVSAGLYYFIIQEVATLGQFLILVIVTSVLEIIIAVTMYRNIALVIGGELDIAGLTKII